MSSLLTLPRELRYQIIDTALALSQPLVDPNIQKSPRKPLSEEPDILVQEVRPYEVYNTWGLLLTNRQLHKEAKDILEGKKNKHRYYRVDAVLTATSFAANTLANNPTYSDVFVSVDNMFKLRPTYTCIPVPLSPTLSASTISTLDIMIHHDVSESLSQYPLEDWLYTRVIIRLVHALDKLLPHLVEHFLSICGLSKSERFAVNRINIKINLGTPRSPNEDIQHYFDKWRRLRPAFESWLRASVATHMSIFALRRWTVHETAIIICFRFSDRYIERGMSGNGANASSVNSDQIINDIVKAPKSQFGRYEDPDTFILWNYTTLRQYLQAKPMVPPPYTRATDSSNPPNSHNRAATNPTSAQTPH
jgi:hypothetical protein